jgi:glucose dehydrogenase
VSSVGMRRISLFLCAASLLLPEPGLAAGQAKKAASNQPWPVYGGQSEGDHYSGLTQINRRNVKDLRQAWVFDTGEHGIMQTSPIVVGRLLYAATPSQKIIALDGATGKLQWKFDSGIKGTQPIRGVVYWQDGPHGRILAGVMNYLYELDAATGRPVESFGESGRIDLRKDLGVDPETATVALTSPGILYKDLIIVGFRAPETHPAPPGDIRAFDLRTGKLRWSFHTIPHPGEFGYDTWPKEAWKYSGAANNWCGMTVDQRRGIVYVPTGSAVDDFYGADRTGDDLFANTLLALDAETGRRIWHFQGVHHDIWDRDFPSPPALLTVTHQGKRVDAVAQTSKQGYVFLFDRVSGEPLFPIEEVNVSRSTVPGEITSPTQPRPLLPEPLTRQQLTADMLTTRTPEMHAWALKTFSTTRSGVQFTPFAVDVQTIVMPGFDGGAEWGGPAVDVRTGVLYVNTNEIAYTGGLVENRQSQGAGASTYFSQCSLCHGEHREGSPPAFPSLVGVADRRSRAEMEEVIHDGKGRMPSFPNLKNDTLAALLEYLRTGKDDGPPLTAHAAVQSSPIGTPSGIAANPNAASLFDRKCAICHGDTGAGIQPGFPSLVGVGQRLTPQQVTAIIRDGRGRMPAFNKLQDHDLNDLLRYLGARDLTGSGGEKELEAAGSVELRYRFTGYKRFVDPEGYPAIAPPWGTLNAIDLNTGKYLWKVPFGEYPELASHGMANTGTENYGGPVVTAGGVLFIAATIFDRQFHAYDSRTGELLWHTELPFGGLATPATYMISGRQYVVIGAGGGKDPKHNTGGLYVAFALP